MKKLTVAALAASFVCAAVFSTSYAAQAPRGAGAAGARGTGRGAGAAGARGGQEQAPPAESRVIMDGDKEILTFESEENYAKLQELYKESQQNPAKPGTHTLRYFRSAMDGSIQPYTLWIPTAYNKNTPTALVVQLHGISRTDGVANKRVIWPGMRQHDWTDEYTPAIQVGPLGRTNNSYSVMGEQDIFEVMNDVKSHFNVDPTRVFLMGHSMGGAGTMSVGLHYPAMFGSLTPIDAAGGREADNKWYANASNMNIYMKDAGNGIGGGADNSHVDALNALGAFATREIFPGMPHDFGPQRPYAMFVPEAAQQPIPVGAPKVDFYTDSLRYNGAYWITIDQLIQPNSDSTLHAVYDNGQPAPRRGGAAPAAPAEGEAAPAPTPGNPSIKIDTTNIAAMTLNLAGTVAPEDASMPVTVDGQTVLDGKLPKAAYVALVDGKWKQVDQPALAGKRHGLQGPVWDAFTTPFLGVYGEGAGAKELAIAELDAVRSKGTFHGDFQIKSAAKVTQDDVKNYSLILFGGPEANSVVKRIADKLPAALMEGKHDGANGVVMIQPNPENPERYAVIWTAKLLSAPPAPTPTPAAEAAAPEAAAGARGGRGGGRGGGGPSLRSMKDYTVVRDGAIAQSGNFNNDWKMD